MKTFFLFTLGLFIGSFLNVCIHRLPTDSFFSPIHSRCPKCKHRLFLLDLIPVFSFIFLRGKCRYCQKGISYYYPLVEISTAIAYSFIGIFCSNFYNCTSYIVFISTLIIIFFTDLKSYIIPDCLTIPCFFIWTALAAVQGSLIPSILGSAIGLIIFSTISIIGKIIYKKPVIGSGDIKLIIMIGAFLGSYRLLLMIYFSFMFAGITSIIIIIFKLKDRKDYIPLGPFLVIGSICSLLLTANRN